MNEINKGLEENFGSFDTNERFLVIDKMVRDLSKGNKLNLMIYDEEYLYVHKNEEKTLYKKEVDGAVLISTQALDDGTWEEFPQNQLIVYNQGDVVYRGEKHNNTYVQDDERMKLLFLAYSGL